MRHFVCRSGLFILGAGASTGSAPLGSAFWNAPALDYLRNQRGFSIHTPDHSELSQRIIEESRGLTLSEIFHDREIRPGSEYPKTEIMSRMPDLYAQFVVKHHLVKESFGNRKNHSYGVFQFFRPSLIANYNHDGLAARFCGRHHRLLDMHGTIEREFGSPKLRDVIDSLREFHAPHFPDGLLMGVPEPRLSPSLAMKWLEIWQCSPEFIAIIGYSFARRTNGSFDDSVSLEYFENRFRGFRGDVFVIDPYPDDLQIMLSDHLKSKEVFPVRARWNVLAHAFVKSLRTHGKRAAINNMYDTLSYNYGDGAAFPIAIKDADRS